MIIEENKFAQYNEVKALEELGRKMLRGEITEKEFYEAAAELGYDIEALKKGFDARKGS